MPALGTPMMPTSAISRSSSTQPSLGARLAPLGHTRRLVARIGEAGVAPAAAPSPAHSQVLPRQLEISEQVAADGIPHDRAGRDVQGQVVSLFAGAVAAPAPLAVRRAEARR